MRKPNRLRIRLPRWPSKDHRSYQSAGRLAGWRGRRAQPPEVAEVAPQRPRGSQAPALGMIVKVRREDALLHVDLRACDPLRDGRARVLAPDVPGAGPADAASDQGAGSGEGRSWTVTLLLN